MVPNVFLYDLPIVHIFSTTCPRLVNLYQLIELLQTSAYTLTYFGETQVKLTWFTHVSKSLKQNPKRGTVTERDFRKNP